MIFYFARINWLFYACTSIFLHLLGFTGFSMHALRFSYTMHALQNFSWLCMHFFIACAFTRGFTQLPGERFFSEKGFFREGETVFVPVEDGRPHPSPQRCTVFGRQRSTT